MQASAFFFGSFTLIGVMAVFFAIETLYVAFVSLFTSCVPATLMLTTTTPAAPSSTVAASTTASTSIRTALLAGALAALLLVLTIREEKMPIACSTASTASRHTTSALVVGLQPAHRLLKLHSFEVTKLLHPGDAVDESHGDRVKQLLHQSRILQGAAEIAVTHRHPGDAPGELIQRLTVLHAHGVELALQGL